MLEWSGERVDTIGKRKKKKVGLQGGFYSLWKVARSAVHKNDRREEAGRAMLSASLPDMQHGKGAARAKKKDTMNRNAR